MAGVNFKIDSFAIGAGVYFPFGGQAKWDKNEAFENSNQYPGPVDGVQRWHTIDGTIRTMYVTVAAAYDILERVSIGASFNLVRSEIKTIRAREPGGTNDVGNEGRSVIDVSGIHGAFGAGLMGEVVPRKLWLGFSFQSQPGVAGDMQLEGTLKNRFGGTAPDESEVKLFQQLPPVYRAGVRARPSEDFEFRFTGEVINWGVLDNQCLVAKEQDGVESTECDVDKNGKAISTPLPIQNIKRNWGPAFALRVGASYFVSNAVELFGGVGYDSSAVPDSTLDPALMDFHDFSPAIGAKFRAGSIFAAAVSYTQFIYLPRDNSGESTLAGLDAPSRTPDGGGQYSQAIGALNANVELVFP
jgi:long-chain fatty acid transport protein